MKEKELFNMLIILTLCHSLTYNIIKINNKTETLAQCLKSADSWELLSECTM